MITRRQSPSTPAAAVFRSLSLALIVIGLGPCSALAAPPDPSAVTSAVKFGLQCNATLGTIEDVELTGTAPGDNGVYIVRGTYKQRIGGINIFGMQSADRAGGVFEGTYDSNGRKLLELQFKISLRAGNVAAMCLR